MEPNQSANPTNAANTSSAADQSQKSQSSGSTNQTSASSSSSPSSSSQQSSGAKNWMEQAGLQKVVDQLPQGVRDFLPNSWEQINKMSTTQKVAGAVALAGLGYLALRSGKSSEKSSKYSDKYSGRYSSPSSGTSYRHTEQNYNAGNMPYGSSTYSDRNNYSGGFDRQNESRVGGNYGSDAASKASPSGTNSSYGSSNSGSNNRSSMANRSEGYRGSSSNSSDAGTSGFGSDDV